MKEVSRKPIAFMSYVRLEDEYEQGRLTEFRKRLSAEVHMYTGQDFPIFQDRIDIPVGKNWKKRIEESLDEVLFLIPIITPGFFNSEACRAELEYFLTRERQLGRNDLILPIYWVDCPLLNNRARLASDELAQVIASRQYSDWRELRFEPVTSPPFGRALAQLAIQIRDTLESIDASVTITADLKRTERDQSNAATLSSIARSSSEMPNPEDSEGTAEITEHKGTKRHPSARNEPPILVVDQSGNSDFCTLTEAIKSADPGDRIVVRPGVYEEGIVIDKPLLIIGEGELDKIVVQATGKDTIAFKTTFGRVVNLTLRQLGGGEWFGVDIAQGRLELEGCDVVSQGSSCVAIHSGADPSIRRNRIHDGRGSGVYVYDNGQGTLEDNEVFSNTLAGVAITNGGNPILRRNRVHDGKREGIIIYDNGQGTIEDNSIFANTFSGVEIRADSSPLLRGNRIYYGRAGGVYVHKNAKGMLEENEIFGNSFAGVAISTDANPTLRRNFIHDNKQSGVFINKNGQGLLEEDDIFGNFSSGVEIKTGGNPTLRNNRINKNGHFAVWIGEGGGGTVENNDLRDNGRGACYVSADCEPGVNRSGNQEH